jgi:DegV family protein with EDD domain
LHVLTGHSFSDGLQAGAYAVVKGQAKLDRINVFPVADADTGANLAATLTAAAAGLGRTPPAGLGAAARAAADGALLGARGNSGAIFAQFLHGLASALQPKHQAHAKEFAFAASGGVQSAYRAVQHPREGTMLSVLRAWARGLAENAEHAPDFRDLMTRALTAAQAALAATPAQLEVLARHRVVDAGGQGFVYFLEGMLDMLSGRRSGGAALQAEPGIPAGYQELIGRSGLRTSGFVAGMTSVSGRPDQIDRRFRYCAEALLAGDGLDAGAVRAAVADLGESLVVAGGGRRIRVHLHTSHPAEFRAALESVASIESFKIDDLVAQQTRAGTGRIALVTDSTVDLPEAAQLRFRVVIVPLSVVIDGRTYLDRVELAPTDFYSRMRRSRELPRTSQPARANLRSVYEALLEEHQSVVSIHLSPRMSGTYQSAVGAAGDVDSERVKVVDARHLSVGLGLVVEAAGEAIESGAALSQVVAAAQQAAANTRVFGTTPSLEFAVRGGRVSARTARLAGLVELKPVILFDEEGAARVSGGYVGFNRAIKGIARRAAEFAGAGPARVAVTHADSPRAATYLVEQLRRRFGADQDIAITESGAVITAHAGLGAVAVAASRIDTKLGWKTDSQSDELQGGAP